MIESKIVFGQGGTLFVGSDAVRLYRALTLASALDLAGKGIKVNRAYTPTKLLAAASAITGKAYRRGRYAEAAADVRAWAAAMRAAMPVEHHEGEPG